MVLLLKYLLVMGLELVPVVIEVPGVVVIEVPGVVVIEVPADVVIEVPAGDFCLDSFGA